MRILSLAAVLLALAVANAKAENLEDCRRGAAAEEVGDLDLAITSFTRCIDEGSLTIANMAAAYYNRGGAYERKGEYDQAIKDYDEAIYLDPGYVPTYLNRGNAYQGKGAYDQAIEDYDKAIRLSPGYAQAYYSRAVAYRNKGDQEQALQDYNEATRLDPAYAESPYARPVVTQKAQANSSPADSPPTAREIVIAPAGLTEDDRKSFAAHLVSVRTREGTEVEWKRLQNLYPDLLGHRELIVRSIDLETQGTFFRVMTGPFQDRTRAQDLCTEFKAFEQYCRVVRLTDAR